MRFLAVSFVMLTAPAMAEELTIDRLVASPSLDGPQLSAITFSPDGRLITYLKGKQEDFRQKDLWAYDVAAGDNRLLVDSVELLGGAEEQIDEVEKARRERQRISGSGIVAYHWAPDGQALLFPLSGDLYLKPLDGPARRLTQTDATETDPKFSPDGRYVSYVREQDLFVYDLQDQSERAITADGEGAILNAMAEFVAQEEMGRSTGYWWAPDDRRIVYARVDESPVKQVNRYELAADGSVTSIEQRYPFAGTDNVLIDLKVADLTDPEAAPITLDLGEDRDIYVTRVHWHPDGRHVLVERQDRAQQRLDLLIYDLSKPDSPRTVLTETSETWLNILDGLTFIEDGAAFLWLSEDDGFAHLYRHPIAGGAAQQLTEGDWMITQINRVDEDSGTVFFTATKDGVLERHLYRMPLAGGPITRVTDQPGWHSAVVGPDAERFVDRMSAPDQPPQAIVRSIDGQRLAALSENPLDDTHPYAPYLDGHAERRFGSLTGPEGAELFYSLRLPPDFDETKTYPAIVYVYGGPGAQRVAKRWDIDFTQILARQGYIVFKLDNRGSANRGKTFEDPIYLGMGKPEVADQLAGVDYLKGLGFVDPARIGVYGWSYGGYMTLMLLAKAPDTFQAGVSIAPVSDWALYDTHYTERFLGRPQDSDAYETSSLFAYIDGIANDALLLIHGMADDNVFFDHSVKVMGALQSARVGFDLMTYPGKRHGIRGEDARAHLWTEVLDFFNARLRP